MKKVTFYHEIIDLNSVNSLNDAPENVNRKNPMNSDFKNEIPQNYINNKKKGTTQSRKKFTESEDLILKNYVNFFGTNNWKIVASFIPGRTSRQCRDRYTNYLAPALVRFEWTEQEDMLLAEKYSLFGPQWTKIRQFFPSRSANDIKNRYNYTVCKKIQETQLTYYDINQNMKQNMSHANNNNNVIDTVNTVNDIVINNNDSNNEIKNNEDTLKDSFIENEDILDQIWLFCDNDEFI